MIPSSVQTWVLVGVLWVMYGGSTYAGVAASGERAARQYQQGSTDRPYSSHQANKKSGYAVSYSQYPDYQPEYRTPAYSLDKFFGTVTLPTFDEFLFKLTYVGRAVSVAALVLLAFGLVMKFVGWKIPVMADLKDTVLQHFDKVDARKLEQGWDFLLQALDKYQFKIE